MSESLRPSEPNDANASPRSPDPTVGNAGRGLSYEEPLLFERSSRRGRDRATRCPELRRVPPVPIRRPRSPQSVAARRTCPGAARRCPKWTWSGTSRACPPGTPRSTSASTRSGSCTMKYNPRRSTSGSRGSRASLNCPPAAACREHSPGISWNSLGIVSSSSSPKISGMDHVTLQPAAGAQGELAGVMMIRAYHEQRGEIGGRARSWCPTPRTARTPRAPR